MKRTISLVGAATALCLPSMSFGACLDGACTGTCIWSDGMESYTNGQKLQGVNQWTGWGGTNVTAGEASTERASAGTKSVKIYDAAGTPTGGIDAVVDWGTNNLTAGAYTFLAMQYVPASHTGASYFIMLNTWAVGGTATNNWSTQVQFTDAGEVVADFDGETLPLITDQWVEIRNVIDLDDTAEGRQIFSYGGNLLFDDTWTERISGGGVTTIDALDLFNNDAGPVWYDAICLQVLPQIGACCLNNGSCLNNQSPSQCSTAGGSYKGHGTLCSGVFCPDCTGSCNFPDADAVFNYCTYPLPNTVQSHSILGDTTGAASQNCANDPNGGFPAGVDVIRVVIEEAGTYWFSMCNTASFADNIIRLYADCNCASFVDSDYNACTGGFSELEVVLAAGDYYALVTGFGVTEGAYQLDVFQKCILQCPGGSADENEPGCAVGGDTTNGGCNMDPGTELFSPLDCEASPGYVVCGTTANDGATRDTDWYAITIPSNKKLTWSVEGETDMVSGFIETVDGAFGSADCADGSGYISPFAVRPACLTGSSTINATTENDATYYLFVATPFGDVVECGTLYIATLLCEDPLVVETICPDDPDDWAIETAPPAVGGAPFGNALDTCTSNGSGNATTGYLGQNQSAPTLISLPYCRIQVWSHTQLSLDSITKLTFKVEGRLNANTGGAHNANSWRTQGFNQLTNQWVTTPLDQRGLPNGTNDVTWTKVVLSTDNPPAASYVDPADGEIRIRSAGFNPGNVILPAWGVRLDLYEVTVDTQ
jgi:hypothetical protein